MPPLVERIILTSPFRTWLLGRASDTVRALTGANANAGGSRIVASMAVTRKAVV